MSSTSGITSLGISKFNFITFLRGPAALLVVYSHFVGRYLEGIGQTYWLKRWVDKLFARPLVIVEDFGQLGVMVFFLVSGFIISHVAQRETFGRFLIRRGFRIYPAYWVAVALVVLLDKGVRAQAIGFGTGEWLRIAIITNYVHQPQRIILGVAWTLQIEVMFYVLTAAMLPLLRSRPLIAVSANLGLVAITLYTARRFGGDWFLVAANASYLPYLLIGQILYFYRIQRIRGNISLLLGVTAYLLAVWGIWSMNPTFIEPAQSRTLCLVFALGLVAWAARYAESFGDNVISRFFSDISYSLYLVHGPLGLWLLACLHPRIGYGNAALIALVAVVVAAYAMHLLVERPAIAGGRKLTTIRR